MKKKRRQNKQPFGLELPDHCIGYYIYIFVSILHRYFLWIYCFFLFCCNLFLKPIKWKKSACVSVCVFVAHATCNLVQLLLNNFLSKVLNEVFKWKEAQKQYSRYWLTCPLTLIYCTWACKRFFNPYCCHDAGATFIFNFCFFFVNCLVLVSKQSTEMCKLKG